MKRSFITLIAAAACMFLLIMDAQTALMGAKDGINLCMMTVIPSLFPFFVLSALLTSALSGIRAGFLRPVGRLCGMPPGAEGVFLIGLLGGYPTGAQSVTQLYRSGQLEKTQAQRLLGFCSNAGPAFIFGICGALFPKGWMVWILWLVHILSAVTTGILLKGNGTSQIKPKKPSTQTLPQALDRAIKTTARVCGWIVLFRVLIAFLDRWALWILEPGWKTVIAGILELTNGCCQLGRIENAGSRFVLASAFLSFGGICVWMQTASVVEELGTAMYLRGKLLQTCISVFVSLLVQWLLFPEEHRLTVEPFLLIPMIICVLFVIVFLAIYEKKSSNPVPVGV